MRLGVAAESHYHKIIEIQGDYFHANPLFYNSDDIILNKTAKDIWVRDAYKLQIANCKDIRLMQIWEYDIKNNFQDVSKKISEQINAHL